MGWGWSVWVGGPEIVSVEEAVLLHILEVSSK